MSLTIPIAHDFICPWCWVGLFQAKRLREEFGVKIEWRGYELFPDELPWPDFTPGIAPPANKPPTPSRFELMLAAEHIEIPKVERPHHMRTHNAHEAVEYAKVEGVADELAEALYRAYWEEGQEINDPKVIHRVAKGIIRDRDKLAKAIEKRKFAKNIVGFDDDAYASGIYNVPTFYVGSERLAEQPYSAVREAMGRLTNRSENGGIYQDLKFPDAPKDRPYTYMNMVTTIDGKILSGSRNESVLDLGSKTDHELMQRIESTSDAILMGAQTLRASPATWNPRAFVRVVVSRSGNLPEHAAFFEEGDSYVATCGSSNIELPNGAKLLRAGGERVDFELLLNRLRTSLNVQKLLVLGGSDLNAQLLHAGLVDELFITIAPKVKLGKDVPTYADGEPLSREQMQRYKIVEHHVVEDEIFVRYRRKR